MKCTYRAAELLKENKKLKVHSVYRHTVNIAVNGRILAFHRNAIPSTPLSLALPFSEEEFEHFEKEAKRTGQINMHISAKSSDRYCWISTGNFKQSAGKIILWEDRLDKQGKSNHLEKVNRLNELEKILSVLLPVLTQNHQLGGFSDCAVTTEKRKDDSFITQILREKTAAILSKDILADALENILKVTSKNMNILRGISENSSQNITENRSTKKDMSKDENVTEDKVVSGNCETDFEKLICSLIGLGPGLTPSGDDFLTGILLAFSLQKNIRTYIKTDIETNIRTDIRKDPGTTAARERATTKTKELDRKQQQICKVVSENLERTNDISKEYLLCAMENRFGELYHKLQEELYHGNVSEDIFRRIIHTGHSSGLDTLNGLAVGLKMIRTMNLKQQN